MGVRRALRLVEQALRDNPGSPVHTLGPLIHNARVVEDLRARGVVPIDDIAGIREGIVVVRAHGIGPEQMQQCMRPGIRCIDATCPNVRRIQETVRERDSQGYHVVIVGDASHGEVVGIRGYARSATVVASVAETEALRLPALCIVVGQTTFKRAEYERICAALKSRNPGIDVFHTSCAATEARQVSLMRLAGEADALLVIGGRKSANTAWLFQAGAATGKPCWLIEGASEIPAEIASFARVGISAGASTPDWIVDEVEAALLGM